MFIDILYCKFHQFFGTVYNLLVVFGRTYQWMGSNFDEGPQRAEGQMAMCEFTDATTLRTEKSPPSLGRKRKNRKNVLGGMVGFEGWLFGTFW